MLGIYIQKNLLNSSEVGWAKKCPKTGLRYTHRSVTRCLSASSGVMSFIIQENKNETNYYFPKLNLENGRNFLSHLWAYWWYMQKPLREKASYSWHLSAEYNAQQTARSFHFTREGLLLWKVFQSFHDKIFFHSLCISELLCILSAA